ncbi:alpha-tectorin-like [Entelurus aequoreus]|uniref:alpha-tectorin-like n=1 Tax=Entelurus aequoreus TaxID=161455 RepID=UPI002B1E0B77|nr:alpha-tectorin-like [Entelurus aequoreus]
MSTSHSTVFAKRHKSHPPSCGLKVSLDKSNRNLFALMHLSASIMQHFLFLMAAVSLMPAAESEQINGSCPINYYGKNYTQFNVTFANNVSTMCFGTVEGSDCMILTSATNVTGVFVTTTFTDTASIAALPDLVGTSPCFVAVTFGWFDITFTFHTFIKQGVVLISQFDGNLTTVVEGLPVDTWQLNNTARAEYLSGCRSMSELFLPNTTTFQVGVGLVNCNSTAFLTISEIRDDSVCTVTGSTVIDFSGNSTLVDDRCAYTLYSNSSIHVVGVFKERRRKDVVFLDRVVIELLDSDSVFQLGPGVKVLVNNTNVNISSVSEEHDGLEIHQDQTGVTATIYKTDYNITVFFNGDTAQILLRPPWLLAENLDSLCVNSSSTISDVKSSDFSDQGCETQYSEPADESINCTTVTEHCQVLNGSDFADCHTVVDSGPYIAACNQTLCHYPDVDGLRCEFLEAYAHACSLKLDHMLDDWRTDANCPAPEAFCNDTHCVDHEFCADGINGQINCFCRAIFASDHRSNDTLGDPAVCIDNTASITLVGCLLEEKGFRYTDLHLNDDSCGGHRDMHHMVTFNFSDSNACGTVVTANDSVVVYKNTVTGLNTSEIVANFDKFHVNFSCYHNQPDVQSIRFRFKDNSVFQQVESESWNYTLKMAAYKDALRTQPVMSETDIQLNQRVWVELMTEGLDDNLVFLVTNSCWATSGSSPYGGLRYDLISDG